MSQWAPAPLPRHQLVLISQTLDDAIAADHPIRLLESLLGELDWSEWEARYDGRRGQPPVHPRLVAGAILYGLVKRVRSSRDLEEATRERLDFKWFLGGRTIDHSTFADFRVKFERELKGLNRQIARTMAGRAETAGIVELILDGTRVRANADRNGALGASSLEKIVAACAAQLDQKLDRLGREDAEQDEVAALRREVEGLEAKCDTYRAALEEARRRDEIKRERGDSKTPARVSVSDLDSTILPNKEGGFAPNYTPTAAVESRSGAIVSAGVVSGGDECASVMQAIEDCREVLGEKPGRILADGNFANGESLENLETQGVESYMNVGQDLSEKNPANRPDPTQPIVENRWKDLPRHGQQLSNGAFVYNPAEDRYDCPMGKPLRYEKQGHYHRTGVAYRAYFCPGKAGCPLAEQCVKGNASRRMVCRDQYQDVRDRVAQRMASDAGRAIYKRRAPGIEGVFGTIKQTLGIRQFLLRGIGKVRTEWNWICGAYNLKKMLGIRRSSRAASPKPGAQGAWAPLPA